jgi:6-phosphogluconolactonase
MLSELMQRLGLNLTRCHGIAVGLLIGLLAGPHSSSADNKDHWVLLGSYTGEHSRGIYGMTLDGETGEPGEPQLLAELAHPEFLARHPMLPVLYALTRLPGQGGVAAFTVDAEQRELQPLGEQGVGEGWSNLTHLAVDHTGRMLVAVSYGGGYVVSFPLDDEGRLGEPVTRLRQEGEIGPHAARQKGSYAHSVTVSPGNGWVWVANLGVDRLFPYQLKPADGELVDHPAGQHRSEPGAGPRHTAFSADGRHFYVLDELDCHVSTYAHDEAEGRLTALGRERTLPDDFTEHNTASEIRIHPNGHFLYTANRGHDSLAIFARDPASGLVTRRGTVPCGGQHPRNFNLSPDGRWLVCGHQHSNTLAVFAVDAAEGGLQQIGPSISAPTPVCVLFWE